MGKLRIALLGSPEIRYNDQRIVLPTRKATGLLIYVVVERRVHTREQLMTLFWPDSDIERAQTSLRTTLGYIRKAFPIPVLQIEHDTVTFDVSSPKEVDTDLLLQAAQLATRLHLYQSEIIPALQKTADLFRGDFLSGYSIEDSPEFDDWSSQRREYFHQRGVQVFDTLSRLQMESGQLIDGLRTVAQWITIAPFDEVAYQRQMQLYLATGNRTAVLQSFKTLTLVLSNEFGLQPTVQSHTLAQQAQVMTESSKKRLDPEAECITLNRMAAVTSQSSYDLDTALDLLRQALFMASQLDNPLHLAETNWNLAQTYFYKGRLEAALRHADIAEKMARSIGRDDLLGRILNTKAYIKLWSGATVTQVNICIDEAILIFERLRHLAMKVDCLTVKANVLLAKGYPEAGLQIASEASEISWAIQNDWGIASAAYNLGLALLDAGELERAVAACQTGIMRARTAGHPPLVFFNMLVLAHIWRSDAKVKEALNLHLEAYELGESLKSPFFRLLSLTELCADYAALNNVAKAAHFALQAQALRPYVPYSDYSRATEIEALLGANQNENAQTDLAFMSEQLREDPTNRRLEYFFARSQAMWSWSQGQAQDARAYLGKAAQLASQYGLMTEWTATQEAIRIIDDA